LLLIIACYAVGLLAYLLITNGPSPLPAALQLRTPPANPDEGMTALFSPDGGCTAAIVEQIRQASASVDIEAYLFSSSAIAKAVADVHARGVKVRVILDKDEAHDRLCQASFLVSRGVPVYIDAQHAIAHNKVALIDGKVLITGSFNYTRAAEEQNAENLLILRNHPRIVAAYQANFELHLSHSVPMAAADKVH
jgi:phosphatidylserine/phosphatidylglycerophosphate/cardiolipin synthase-like enzyme